MLLLGSAAFFVVHMNNMQTLQRLRMSTIGLRYFSASALPYEPVPPEIYERVRAEMNKPQQEEWHACMEERHIKFMAAADRGDWRSAERYQNYGRCGSSPKPWQPPAEYHVFIGAVRWLVAMLVPRT